MSIVGQAHAKQELGVLGSVYQRGENFNVLLAGPSGFGKTTLALEWANKTCPGDYWYSIPDEVGGVRAPAGKRLIIIDEAHTIKYPEPLYQHLDAHNRSFMLLTNVAGDLTEALVNRCIRIDLIPYTRSEIADICTSILPLEHDWLEYIAEISGNNPRVAKQLTQRLSYYWKTVCVPVTYDTFIRVIENYLNYTDGLSPAQRVYMDFLAKVKRASLDQIVWGTRLSRSDILRDVEPPLLYRGMIKITSRGREIGES